MKGVCSDELQAIVELIYCGKANLLEENLNSFLALAEELQLKGRRRLFWPKKNCGKSA